MKTLYIVLLAVIAVGAFALVACSDGLSTDEASPLAHDADKVYGVVYDATQVPPKPFEGAPVIVYKRETPFDFWIDIDQISTDENGYYEFHIEPWPVGWYGKVDCTNDLKTGEKRFPYPLQGPVVADIYLK